MKTKPETETDYSEILLHRKSGKPIDISDQLSEADLDLLVDYSNASADKAEADDQVKQAGRALMSLGFEPGDTTTILGFNRPEWCALNVATMGAGGACAET